MYFITCFCVDEYGSNGTKNKGASMKPRNPSGQTVGTALHSGEKRRYYAIIY